MTTRSAAQSQTAQQANGTKTREQRPQDLLRVYYDVAYRNDLKIQERPNCDWLILRPRLLPATINPRGTMKTSNLRKPQISGQTLASEDRSVAQTWRPRNHIRNFVRCLRLLDIDLLEDWPELSELTFSTKPGSQNSQQRSKAVEWSLYRLFEIYDPAETASVSNEITRA